MALALRLRRAAVALSSSPLKPPTLQPSLSSSANAAPRLLGIPSPHRPHSLTRSQSFRSSPPALSGRRFDTVGDKDIDPNEILFEGCDYNHWLITMDFPKDPKPTPEEMVETYVQTLAKVVGSVEEAKKRMYACSTTTFNGFQAVMTEEMSEKFRGLPGVVFILPDSYIDPVNKEYGGDKYDNGVITPRPPPVQYRNPRRSNDQNRNYNQPRFNRQQDPMSSQQGYPPLDRQPPMEGNGRNYAPQQNYGPPQHSYGPPQQNYGPPQQSYGPPQQNHGVSGQDGRGYVPPGGRDYAPQGQRNVAPVQGGDYMHPGPSRSGGQFQGSGPGYNGDYRPGPTPTYNSDNRQGAGSGYGGAFNQGQNYPGPVEGEKESWQGRQ